MTPGGDRRELWLLVGLHLPFVVAGPVTTIPRHELGMQSTTGVALTAAAIGGLQLRHSLAATRGERPAGWPVTFLALVMLVYGLLWWFTWDWSVMQWFVVASGAMLLRGAPALATAVGPIVATAVVWWAQTTPADGLRLNVVSTAYIATLLVMGSAALYGSARLVQVLEDLGAARTELADLAVGQERLRVARDVHDLLGQSLSAVSLKGDLALRLLATDPAAARAEITGLTEVARGALRDVRAVARDEHGVSLAAEVRAAEALLGAVGIATHVDLGAGADTTGRVEAVLAWAVREGATNALRHSQASAWSVSLVGQGGRVRLDIVNDGAPDRPESDHGGHGLAGVAERALALGGSAVAERLPGGRFRLRVEVPR